MTDRVAPEELVEPRVLRLIAVSMRRRNDPNAEVLRRAALYIEKLETVRDLAAKVERHLSMSEDIPLRTFADLRVALQNTPIRGGERSTP